MLDDLASRCPGMTDTELRSLLGCFLFSEDDVFKHDRRALRRRAQPLCAGAHAAAARRISCCSTSRRTTSTCAPKTCCSKPCRTSRDGRLRLARPLLHRQAGHARSSRSADGHVDVYPGNYEDYLWSLERRGESEASATPPGGPSVELLAAMQSAKGEQAKEAASAQNGSEQSRKRMNPIQADKLRKRVSELEREIAKLEQSSQKLQGQMGSAAAFEEQTDLLGQMETVSKRIAESEREWEELNEKLEAEA